MTIVEQQNTEAVREGLADWIDTYVLADAIIENLEELSEPVTVERGKRVWLAFLQNTLHHGIIAEI